jgi:hypothetical protein
MDHQQRLEGNALTLTEPPDADPHVRWCERRALAPPSYSNTLDAVNQYILNRNKQRFSWIIILVFTILGANELILGKLSKKNKP